MKILVIINNLGVGGAERLVVDDINEMLYRGIDVRLLTLKPEKSDKSLKNQCKILDSNWKKVDFGSLLNIKSWIKTIQHINSVKPDLVITHLWYSNTIGRILGKMYGVKKIITFEHNVYDTLKTRKMFFVDRLLQGFSTHIVAVSNAVKDSLVRNGIKKERIKVVLNGIDVSKYQNVETVKNDEFTFIFIGRLIYQKGIDILLKAFKEVQNAKLLLVGDGANKSEFVSLAQELKIEDRVQFLGVREDIPKLLKNSDCFVLPSRYEGLPMVLLEAVAAERPIIVSDFASATEVIKNGKNGIIVPKENIEALREALNKIQNDVEFRESLTNEVSKMSGDVSIKYHVDQILNLVV